jgi:plasmid stabilization system protein ParE
MSVVIYSKSSLQDIERLADFLWEQDANWSDETINIITSAIAILEQHPEIGRPVRARCRELVISRGQSGYLALYRYQAQKDTITIMRIRHQRESGYHSH